MGDDVVRPTTRELINRLFLWVVGVATIVAVVLAVTGEWTSVVGLIVGLLLTFAMSRRIKGPLRKSGEVLSDSRVIWVLAGIETAVGAVFIFVGRLIGGTFIIGLTVALATFLITLSIVLCAAVAGIKTAPR
jgi:hypothetical protein